MADLGFQDGKRLRSVLYGRTRGEVAEKLTTLLADRSRGVEPSVDPDHLTVVVDHEVKFWSISV